MLDSLPPQRGRGGQGGRRARPDSQGERGRRLSTTRQAGPPRQYMGINEDKIPGLLPLLAWTLNFNSVFFVKDTKFKNNSKKCAYVVDKTNNAIHLQNW